MMPGTANSLKAAVTGSTGLIGEALLPALEGAGHTMHRLVRGQAKRDTDIHWSPGEGQINAAALEGMDVVVHLAGESLVGRWTAAKKQRIRDSRVHGTTLLCETLAKLDRKPRVLIGASAIGYYGSRGDDVLDESSHAGKGFLADVAVAWEAATRAAHEAGVRTVIARFGVVLSPRGGALKQMLPIFKLGGGGQVGDGKQWWSWIALEDVVGAIKHIMGCDVLSGPVNLVSPNPVTNQQFTGTLGQALSRPTILPVPKSAVRLALGEMADETLLASQRVRPGVLEQSGYTFQHPRLESALRTLLGH